MNIKTDKLLHFLACFVIAAIASAVYRTFGNETVDSACLGWVTAFIIGAAKEIYDEIKYKGGDVEDWISDIAGFTLGALYALWVLSP